MKGDVTVITLFIKIFTPPNAGHRLTLRLRRLGGSFHAAEVISSKPLDLFADSPIDSLLLIIILHVN